MEITRKFAKNIREIAKSKKLKVGEIEKNVGVAVGTCQGLTQITMKCE